MIKKDIRDAITKQALDEIAFARLVKRTRYTAWHENEDLYYGKSMDRVAPDQRANLNLNEMMSFATTFLSKINNPYNFRFEKGEEADLKPAMRLNALKDKDAKIGQWDYKAMLARLQMVLYGRYVFEYHADSTDGYKSFLTPVDVYQFLIDPSVGGLDLEHAFYMGRGNIIKTKRQIQEGIRKGRYLRTEGNELISGSGDAANDTEEDREAQNRWVALMNQNKIITRPDQWKFWEWYTTFEGDRYYLLLTEDGGKAIACDYLENKFKSGMWPFFSAAAYPDLTEFWTPSPCDGVRDPIKAKAQSINQMIDNAEAVTRPMKAFDVGAIKSPALLKYRTDGLVPVKSGIDINKAIQMYPTTSIQTPMMVYDKMDNVVNVNSGVTNAAKGLASEKILGVYEGNQQNASDRFSLIGDSEAAAQYRFARLYLAGVEEHMTTKVAIEMIGADGVEYEEIGKKELKHGKDFNISIITAGTEETMQTTDKKNKLTFLDKSKGDTSINQKVRAELEATIAGFSTDEVKALLDPDYGNAEILSEAARDIQRLLAGEDIMPNEAANAVYAQKILDFLRDEQENIKPEVADRMFAYLDTLQPIIMRNMVKAVNAKLNEQGAQSIQGMQTDAVLPGVGGGAPEMGASIPPEAAPAPQPPVYNQ